MTTRIVHECSTCHREMRGRPATLEVRMIACRSVGGVAGTELTLRGDDGGTKDFCSPACAEEATRRLIWRAWQGENWR